MTRRYNPETREGKKLLGHELTHVLQQRKGVQRKTPDVQAKIVLIGGGEIAFNDVDPDNSLFPQGTGIDDIFVYQEKWYHRKSLYRVFNKERLNYLGVVRKKWVDNEVDGLRMDAPHWVYHVEDKKGKKVGSLDQIIRDDGYLEATCQSISVGIDIVTDVVTILKVAKASKAWGVIKALLPSKYDAADVKNFTVDKSVLRSLAECVPFLGTVLGMNAMVKGTPKAEGLDLLRERDKDKKPKK
ncbi:MAG: DUF4157 domain-containing protein [bacterium]|nr:DUF4157 domain-containing protein [bacterium]